MSNYNSALTLCLSLVKMFTNTDDKQSLVLFVLFLFCNFSSKVISYSIGNNDIDSNDYFNDESITSCIPCDRSIHYTLRVLNKSDYIDKISDQECYHKGILSLMMNHYDNELDLAISITNPFVNKNKWCRFQVYWKDEIQATILLNQNNSMISSNNSWSLIPSSGSTNFWLIKKASTENSYSGKKNIVIQRIIQH